MKASDITERLLSEGCTQNNFSVLAQGHDCFCLGEQHGEWSIYYTERGCDSAPIFKSHNEEEACEFFYNYIKKFDHWHIVGFFKEEADAKLLENKLDAINVTPIRNDIPAYKTHDDPRYRVFVVGTNIFEVKKHFGDIHIDYT